METATQTLHRLTSYTSGHRWDQPADDPRVLQDLRTNDMDRFPWFTSAIRSARRRSTRCPVPPGSRARPAAAAAAPAGNSTGTIAGKV